MATPEIAPLARVGRLPYARHLRESLAAGTLAGLVAVAFVFSSEAASGHTYFVRGSELPGLRYHGWLAGPLAGLGHRLTDPRFIALSAGFWILYLLALALADYVRPSWAVAAIALLHVVFVLGPPTWLSDSFNYLGFARLGALHGLDPYTHHIDAIRSDPVFPYVTWAGITTPYGPLFTLFSYALVPLGLAGGLWALKVLVAAASLVCLALVWRLAEALGRAPVPAVLFVGANPLWILYGVGGAHNDMFVLALVLGAALLALRGRGALAGGALVGAAAIKVTAGLALPFMWAASRQRRRLLLGALVTAVGVMAATLLASRGHLVAALTSFAGEKQRSSPRSFPGQLAQTYVGVKDIPPEIHTALIAAFVVVLVVMLLRTWRGGDWMAGLGWSTLALLLALSWVMPWYISWLLPFAALAADRRLRYAALLFGTFLVVARMPYPPFA